MSRGAWCFVLIVGVFVSAIAVVYVKHETRKKFVSLQDLERTRDEMRIEWGRLRIEEGALSNADRISQTARQELGLVKPTIKQTVLVTP
ncbi:MAG: cell division protein FtsL [Pseudomonadota bacterium]